MIIGHYSVLDRKAKEYSPVFSAKNDDVARRIIVNSLRQDSQLVLYPADYVVVHLCDFDMESGDIIKLEGSFIHVVAELVDLIPEHLRSYCLDGTFPRGERNETTSQSEAKKS